TINFDKEMPDPKYVVKNASLIRGVTVSMEDDFKTLELMGAGNLWHLDYSIRLSVCSWKVFIDLLSRNKVMLKTLVIYGGELHVNAFGQPRRVNDLFFTRAASHLGSNLSRLELVDLHITRDALLTVLEASPGLRFLSLMLTSIYFKYSTLDPFRHQGISTLSTSMGPDWTHDSFQEGISSLLIHFPALESWTIEGATLLALINHQKSLVYLELSSISPSCAPNAPDRNPSAKEPLEIILRCCSRLEVLSIRGHRMGVSTLENGCQDNAWVCYGLQKFRVRFHGLETMTAVNDCLDQLWTRKRIVALTGVDTGAESEEESMAKRVCDQLMRFKELDTVWLGTRDYCLATY
ncbi:hypothetical protein BGZ47_001074, partial [Haplosporangium gracile]